MTLYENRFHAMGCHMLAALDKANPWAADPLEDVPAWFETWEQHLSRFRVDSELSRLNRSGGRPFPASPVLWDVFQAALAAGRRSQGWVTPTIYDALLDSGYDRSFETGLAVVGAPPQALASPAPPLEAIQADPRRQTLRLPAGTHLDFGGVAKGWAAGQALQRLQAAGPALVDAGGDVAVGARRLDGSAWPVGVGDPFHPGDYGEVLMLSDCGVATSGRDYRRWLRDGVWQHHLIDPHTGQPARTQVISATVIAPDVVAAEVAAKVVLLRGAGPGLEWLESQPDHAGMLILEDGRHVYSRHFAEWMEREI
ncbi:MAG: FAD:protein FMN transferase [Chloroflexi bacterium]|nr:FAD:protein FMN transferase [Chloroflexota bacterium]